MISSSKKLAELCQKNKPVWMGILNITPDSFSDGGQFENVSHALKRADELLSAGAHMLDVGGVSTRPGSEHVSFREELKRVLPVALNLRKNFPGVLLSIDTFRPGVVRALAEEGLVDLVNDIYAGRWTEDGETGSTLDVAAEFDLGVALMHMQGEPKTMQQNPYYIDCVSEVTGFLSERLQVAKNAGINFVCVDPGIGFGKRLQDNLDLLSNKGIQACATLGAPLLIGLSRKRFVGEIFKGDSVDMTIPQNRDARSKELELEAIKMGASIIRSHTMPMEIPA